MIRLARGTMLTPRRGEGQASSSVCAGIAGCAVGAVVAVIILGASHTYLDADIRVTAGSGGIAVIIELSLICAQYGSDGALATVFANATVDAWRGTVRVAIRFASRARNARCPNGFFDQVCPVLPCIALSARRRRVQIAVHQPELAFFASNAPTSGVCPVCALGAWCCRVLVRICLTSGAGFADGRSIGCKVPGCARPTIIDRAATP